MAKSGRPAYNCSRQRVEVIGNADKTMSTTVGDSDNTSVDSGVLYIIQTAKTASGRTITLPPMSAGAHVRILWGVDDDAQDTLITTSVNTENIVGQLAMFDSNGAADGRDISSATRLCTATTSDITVPDNVEPGAFLNLVSDGSYWYVVGSHIFGTEALTIANG